MRAPVIRGVKANAVAARSPAYVRVVDSTGRRAGFLDNGPTVAEILGADVFQLDGERYVLYRDADTASVDPNGTATIDLIASLAQRGDKTVTVEYRAVFVTAATRGSISASVGDYTLHLDDSGDGTADRNVRPDEITEQQIYRVGLPWVSIDR